MTCCCTINSIILVVSGATSAVSPETNIIWNTCSVSTWNLHPKRECSIVEEGFRVYGRIGLCIEALKISRMQSWFQVEHL
jgi:hypothetical protein